MWYRSSTVRLIALRTRLVLITIDQSVVVGRASSQGASDRRARKDNLLFANKTISRKHAKIHNRSDGLWICDHGSQNGTRLSDKSNRFDVGLEPEQIYPNDTLQFGDFVPGTGPGTQYKPITGQITMVFSPKPAMKLSVNSYGLAYQDDKITLDAKRIKDEQECVYLGATAPVQIESDVVSVSSDEDHCDCDEDDPAGACGKAGCWHYLGENPSANQTDNRGVDQGVSNANLSDFSDAESITSSTPDDAARQSLKSDIESFCASLTQVAAVPVNNAVAATSDGDRQVQAIATAAGSAACPVAAALSQSVEVAAPGEPAPDVSCIPKPAPIEPFTKSLAPDTKKSTKPAAALCNDRLLAARDELDGTTNTIDAVVTPDRQTENLVSVPRPQVQASSDSVVATSGSDIADFPLIVNDKVPKAAQPSSNEPANAVHPGKVSTDDKPPDPATAGALDVKDTNPAVDAAESEKSDQPVYRWSVRCASLLLAPDIEKPMDAFLLESHDPDKDALDANARALIESSTPIDDVASEDEGEESSDSALSVELASECQALRKEAGVAFEAEMMAKLIHERGATQTPSEVQTQAQLYLAAYKADSSVADVCLRSSIFPSSMSQAADGLSSHALGSQASDITKILTGLRNELDLQAQLIRELSILHKRKHSDVAVNTDEEIVSSKRAKHMPAEVPCSPDTTMVEAAVFAATPSNSGQATHFAKTHKRNTSSWRQSMMRVLGGAVLGSAVTIGGLLAYGQ